MLKSLLTSGSILELFSRMSFKHSVNVISNVVKGVKIKGLRTSTEGRRLRLWRVGNLNNALSVP